MLLGEDILYQFLVPRPHENLVVRNVFVLAVGSKVDHKQAHRVSHLLDVLVGIVLAVGGFDQTEV